MAIRGINEFVGHLRRAVSPDVAAADEDLLRRFAATGDEAAFATLVGRHGPLVWGVCRRVVGHEQDAEDAFQASFLVLAKKAASVRSAGCLANWLFGVARKAALKARAVAAKRRMREAQVADLPEREAAPQEPSDLPAVLDEEVARLPARHRAVVLLCDVEGKTRAEAAAQLGVPEGTVASRLARARATLARRLTRRGVASAGSLAATAAVPGSVACSTTRAASLFAAGQTAATSARVAALTQGVLKAMLIARLKAMAAVLMGLSVVALSCFLVMGRADGRPEAAEKPADKKAAGRASAGAADADDLVRPGDRLQIQVNEALPNAPIKGVFRVEPKGTVALGTPYGRVNITGETLERAEAIIHHHLKMYVKEPAVSVTRYDPLPEGKTEALARRVEQLEKEVRALRAAVEQLRAEKKR